MSVIHTPPKPQLDARILLFPSILFVLLGIAFLRLWYYQVVMSDELRERAQAMGTSKVDTLAPRGLIYDRKGVLLAGVRPEIVITAIPAMMREHPEVLHKLSAITGIEAKELKKKTEDGFWKPYLPTPIIIGMPIEKAGLIAESAYELPGIAVQTQPMRYYPDSLHFTHLLGYVLVPDERDRDRLKKKDLDPADYVGKTGIEYVYEQHLMGAPGAERMDVDAKRRPIRIVGRDNPVPGEKLVLSIDAKLQQLASELLKGRRGGAVAIDPKTGEILCLVSSPTYDESLFHGRISKADYLKLKQDANLPQLDRATYSSHSPGSTFKIVTTIAAERAGFFNPLSTCFCPGYYQIGRRKSKCLGVHHAISFENAMARSCNTYFSDLAFRAGRERLIQAALDVGLGKPTEIDLRGEGGGIVPTDAWCEKVGKKWYGGDTVNLGIGQGELRCTPLQMANVVALVANNGISYKPHVLHAKVATDGKAAYVEPVIAHQIDMPEGFWAELKRALIGVVDHGTAARVKMQGLVWGGKTGSSEHRKKEKTHSWFVGFAPADDPKIALCVFVEAAGHGSDVAAPIAGKMVENYVLKRSSASAAATGPAVSARNTLGPNVAPR